MDENLSDKLRSDLVHEGSKIRTIVKEESLAVVTKKKNYSSIIRLLTDSREKVMQIFFSEGPHERAT